MAEIDDILKEFAESKTVAPSQGGGGADPIKAYKRSVDKQIEKIKTVEANPSTEIKVTDWFKRLGDGWRFRLGKKAIPLRGDTHFLRNELSEVRAMLEKAKILVDHDKEFQSEVLKKMKEWSEKASSYKKPTSKSTKK